MQNTEFMEAIFNDGERLIPGETHDFLETVRHKSSYEFFKRIIEADILSDPIVLKNKIRILDIGCGTGHGTFMLASILGAEITGLELGLEAFQYAKENYGSPNINYINDSLENFVIKPQAFDYIVSRHCLEHVEDGLNFALKIPYAKRLIVNVPFNEAEGNIYHLVNWITEDDFRAYPNKEFFYESLRGETASSRVEKKPPNSIICISSSADLKPVTGLFNYPLQAWKPEFLQSIGLVYNVTYKIRMEELKNLETELKNRDSELQEKEKIIQSIRDAQEDIIKQTTVLVAFNVLCTPFLIRMLMQTHEKFLVVCERIIGFPKLLYSKVSNTFIGKFYRGCKNNLKNFLR